MSEISDQFKTVSSPASARLTVKMSRFLSFIHPVNSAEEAKDIIREYTAKYHDARHVCWAYMLGCRREEWQLSDNGEPSGTAGRPILGQINSAALTDVMIIVVRYFGGIKLGTPGLIAAYREAARLAIEESHIIECYDMATIDLQFPYESINAVMKIAKQQGIKVLSQEFDNICHLSLQIRRSEAQPLRERLTKIDGAYLLA